jgi:hypothetical protein
MLKPPAMSLVSLVYNGRSLFANNSFPSCRIMFCLVKRVYIIIFAEAIYGEMTP